jgi:hypothetical protein
VPDNERLIKVFKNIRVFEGFGKPFFVFRINLRSKKYGEVTNGGRHRRFIEYQTRTGVGVGEGKGFALRAARQAADAL